MRSYLDGAGEAFIFFVAPSVMALGLFGHSHKQLLRAQAPALVVAVLVAAPASLAFTAVGLWASVTFWNKNLIQMAMGKQIRFKPEAEQQLWPQLNLAWSLFFLGMGLLNLYVAYQFDEATWVNFKLFGGMGLLFAFVLAQGFWLNKFIDHEEA